MTQVISIVASLFNVLSGASYFKQIIKRESVPNPATWFIWFVVTILNTFTYSLVVEGNILVSLASIVLAFEIAIIFIFSLFNGKFSKLGTIEIISLMVVFITGIFYKITGNAIIANLLLQAIFVISFYPTLHGLLVKTGKEQPLPWVFASASYVLQILNIFLIGTVTLFALAFPIVNLFGNGVIGIVAWRQSQRDV